MYVHGRQVCQKCEVSEVAVQLCSYGVCRAVRCGEMVNWVRVDGMRIIPQGWQTVEQLARWSGHGDLYEPLEVLLALYG